VTALLPARRALLWGVLVVVLLGIAIAALTRPGRPWQPRYPLSPTLPVLGTVPPFSLTNRDGRPVTRETLAGAPWIADFIFTRCPSSCPMMTAHMARLDRAMTTGERVHLVSFSVDPANDTPEVLARYAASVRAGDRWFFLTGPAAAVRQLSRDGFKLAVDVPTVPGKEPIVHSTRFVLVDGEGRIRGYYDGFDPAAVERLLGDVRSLG
jgi:protein SCO1/2